MRLWSLHPKYLDAKGLVACWREGLLARKVLLGQTKGYTNHPQLRRFKDESTPTALIDAYLSSVHKEAASRGYTFDKTKIGPEFSRAKLLVTDGQLLYEFEWLRSKLIARDPARMMSFSVTKTPLSHPLFRVVSGGVETWEIIPPQTSRKTDK